MAAGVQAAIEAGLAVGITFPLHEAGHMTLQILLREYLEGHATQKGMPSRPNNDARKATSMFGRDS
jgi:hypothetical protein